MKHAFPLLAGMLAIAATALAQDDNIKFAVPGSAPAAASAAPAAAPAPAATFTQEQLAEEFGWFIAKKIGIADLKFSPSESAAVLRGIDSALAGKDAPYDLQAIGPQMDAFMQQKQADYLARLKQQSESQAAAFFAQLKQDKDIVQSPSGLCYQILDPGKGPPPKPGDTVKVNYTGRLLDGTVFDTTLQARQPGATPEPAEVQLGDGVIAGWTEGLQKIGKGGKIKLYIPSQLAYGDQGRDGIPPGAALVFDIDLLDINPAGAPAAK
jgi:FKBP-type peptidyl-prolyl cis-trans isomerase